MEMQSLSRFGQARLVVTACLAWFSVLFSSTLAHLAVSCALASPVLPFITASSAMLIGSMVTPYAAELLGFAAAARLVFVFNALVAVASAVVHADDYIVLTTLLCVSGFTAGGNHVILSYLMQLSPESRQSRLFAAFPLLLFPVALVQQFLEFLPVNVALFMGIAMTVATAVCLFTLGELPQSPPTQSSQPTTPTEALRDPRTLRRAPRPSPEVKPILPLEPQDSQSPSEPALDVASIVRTAYERKPSDVTEGEQLVSPSEDTEVLLTGAEANTRRGAKPSWSCGISGKSCVVVPWVVLCTVYFASSLTFLTPVGEPMLADHAACQWRFAKQRLDTANDGNTSGRR
jgi:hypothetical protein